MKVTVPMMVGVDFSEMQMTFLKQMGVESTLLLFKDLGPNDSKDDSPLTRLRNNTYYDLDDLQIMKKWVERYGLELSGLVTIANQNKRWENVVLGKKGRDEQIENFWIKSIRNMAKAGLYTYQVSMNVNRGCRMPVWRTSREKTGRGGTEIVKFDYEVAKKEPITEIGEISAEEMWKNVDYFVRAVMPVAEEVGVRLAFHPFDPQVPSLAGIARILASVESYDRLYAIAPCRANAITFCIGSFGQFLDNNGIISAIRHFGDRIANVHFRNVRGSIDKFEEVWPDDGQIDLLEVVKVLKEIGYDGCVTLDSGLGHSCVPIGGDPLGRINCGFSVGYMKGIMQGAGAI